MTMNRAIFPIQGPIANPTADHYATEAMLLRERGAALAHRNYWAPGRYTSGATDRCYRLARRFEAVARRLSWVPIRQYEEERKSA